MNQNKIILYKNYFLEKEHLFLENGSLKVSLFRYETGVEAIKVCNKKGYIVMLPYQGQQIWEISFLDHDLKMKSNFREPVKTEDFVSTYGGFLLHCGLTAMGNPSAEDTHPQHGELPNAIYQTSFLQCGEDAKGKYVAVGGIYNHNKAFEVNYDFTPICKLYENASEVEVEISFRNKRKKALEYFYLCHINFRPVDGLKLFYPAKRECIKIHKDIPKNMCPERRQRLQDYMESLEKDTTLQDVIDSKKQCYDPEIVFTVKYDEVREAYTLGMLPDGYGYYVKHNPKELPYGIRWISRTGDEDALGMVLPATAEHHGYLDCKKNGYERYLMEGESIIYHISIGIADPKESRKITEELAY